MNHVESAFRDEPTTGLKNLRSHKPVVKQVKFRCSLLVNYFMLHVRFPCKKSKNDLGQVICTCTKHRRSFKCQRWIEEGFTSLKFYFIFVAYHRNKTLRQKQYRFLFSKMPILSFLPACLIKTKSRHNRPFSTVHRVVNLMVSIRQLYDYLHYYFFEDEHQSTHLFSLLG